MSDLSNTHLLRLTNMGNSLLDAHPLPKVQ